MDLFSLIIGIDKYQDHSDGFEDLEGSVYDARSIQKFLKDHLHVPAHHIQLLINHQASRDAILSTFRHHLIKNPNIKHGDPIVIYYAGHGSRVPAPEGWPTDDGLYESICPADRNTLINGHAVPDILDRQLGVMLVELANAKGNNIVCIMDCCHSGSGTRSGSPSIDPTKRMRARCAPPLRDPAVIARMFADALLADEHGKVSKPSVRHAKMLPSLHHSDMSSHVLLSACRQDEQSWESPGGAGGLFTSELLTMLRKSNLPRTTYANIMSKIGPLTAYDSDSVRQIQNPQCEGRHSRRILFEGKALGVDKRLIPVTKDSAHPNRWHLEAGDIHGIAQGAEFIVRSSQLHSASVLGRMTAVEVHALECVVSGDDGFSPIEGSHAMVSFWANEPYNLALRSPTPEDDEAASRHAYVEAKLEAYGASDACKHEQRNEISDMHIIRTEAETAQMIVAVKDDMVEIERRDPLVSGNCPESVRLDQLSSDGLDEWEMLNLAVRFNFHLYRENPKHPYADKISMELHRVDKDAPPYKGPKAEIQWDPDASYAFHLHNYSQEDLWCTVFYFDPSDYSITSLYTPNSRTGIAPLRAGKDLVLGEGSAGVPPFFFYVNENEERDAGFIKVLISSVYTDIELMEQGRGFVYVPFDPDRNRGGSWIQGVGQQWDSLIFVAAVHRHMPLTFASC